MSAPYTPDELALDILAAVLRRVSYSYASGHRVRPMAVASEAAGMLSGALVIARDGDLISDLIDLQRAAWAAATADEVAQSSADFRAGYDAALPPAALAAEDRGDLLGADRLRHRALLARRSAVVVTWQAPGSVL